MTPAQRRALEVLWEWEPLTRDEFALRAWSYKAHDYRVIGAAETFLLRLKKLGLIESYGTGWSGVGADRAWTLSELGQRVLRRERILEKIA